MRRYWILEEQTFSQDLCNCCSSLWNLPVILVYFNISSELLGMERMLSTSEYVISSHFMRRGMAPSHCASGMFTKCWSCFEEFYCTYLHHISTISPPSFSSILSMSRLPSCPRYLWQDMMRHDETLETQELARLNFNVLRPPAWQKMSKPEKVSIQNIEQQTKKHMYWAVLTCRNSCLVGSCT